MSGYSSNLSQSSYDSATSSSAGTPLKVQALGSFHRDPNTFNEKFLTNHIVMVSTYVTNKSKDSTMDHPEMSKIDGLFFVDKISGKTSPFTNVEDFPNLVLKNAAGDYLEHFPQDETASAASNSSMPLLERVASGSMDRRHDEP